MTMNSHFCQLRLGLGYGLEAIKLLGLELATLCQC